MEPIALDLRERPSRISWNSQMRVFLCCMIKYFERNPSAFRDIFYGRFKEELNVFGVTNIAWNKINTQWESLRRDGHPDWGDVHCSTFDPEPWLPVIKEIEYIATSLDLDIIRKSRDSVDCSRFSYREREPVRRLQYQLFTQDESSQEVESSEDVPALASPQNDPSKESQPPPEDLFLPTAGGKVCLFCHLEGLGQVAANGLDSADTPVLLYRWWNVDSQGVNSKSMFIAGFFADTSDAYFEHDTISQDEFDRYLLSHIKIEHSPSPFISTFKSVLAPIHRGLRNQEGASVSIIDTKKLKSKVFSAMAFVRKHRVKIGTYNGAGEHLVWGRIEKDAVICSFKITALRQIAGEHTDIARFLQLDTIFASKRNRKHLHQVMAKQAMHLDKRSGAIIGRLLSFLEIPHEYCLTVSEGMAYSWRIKSRRIPWRDFFEGVELGYRGQQVMLSPSLSPVASADSDVLGPGLVTITDDELSFDDDDDEEEEEEDEEVVDEESDEDPLDETDAHHSGILPDRGMVPTVNLAAKPEPLVRPRDITIAIIDSSEEEMDAADGLEIFNEVLAGGQQITSDQFANDRARVTSALH